MKHSLLSAFVLVLLLTVPAISAQAGELADNGPNGHFFHDPDSGLYWFDVVLLENDIRSIFDAFVTDSPSWSWATGTQVDALVGQSAPDGQTLSSIMGDSQTGQDGAVSRWIGFHAGEGQPDGWLVQTSSTPFTTLDSSSFQSQVDNFTRGAFLIASVDPVTMPRLHNLGDSDEYFHDTNTDLYWCDPVTFEGQTRVEIQAWIDGQTDWRWATAEEIHELVGMMTEGDVDTIDILGDPQVTGQVSRWVGYYAQSTQPDGMLLEARWLPERSLITTVGTQAGAVNWDPGAWIVSESDPTPVEAKSLSSIKNSFR